MTLWHATLGRELLAIAFLWRRGAAEPPRRRWLAHAVLWAGVLALLTGVNRLNGLQRLHTPWPIVQGAWLPLFGVGVYLLAWLGRGLWEALDADAARAVDADLAAAWREASRTAPDAGLPFAQRPVFLMIGPLGAELQSVIASGGAQPLAASADGAWHVFVHPAANVLACSRRTALEEFCLLITRERRERAPLQGIVLALSASALQSDRACDALLATCRTDLNIVRQTTGVDVPIYLAVTGLDLAQETDREGAWQRFPPLPDCDPGEIVAMYQAGVEALCVAQMPRKARGDCRLAVEPGANARLHRAVTPLLPLRRRLQRLLVAATGPDPSEPGMVAGCYFLPTTPLPAEQIHPLWTDLLTQQRYVIRASAA